MFDSLLCEAPLPLDEVAGKLNVNWAEEVFQTKCLDNTLTQYRITKDGQLIEDVVEHEYILYTEQELKTLKPKPWTVIKETIVKDRYQRNINYHGKVIFYTSLNMSEEKDLWVEFEACFIYGKLDKINLVKTEESKSQKAISVEWRILRETEARQPWNKFKRKVGPFGWYWVWRKTVKIMRFAGRLLEDLSFQINKHLL